MATKSKTVVGGGFQRAGIEQKRRLIICSKALPKCVAGDTVIGINRGGKSYQGTIAYLEKMQNGGSSWGKSFDPSIPTTIRTFDSSSDVIRLGILSAVVSSGRKETWSLATSQGHILRATPDHQILTKDGWAQLRDLRIGNSVMVDDGKGIENPKGKQYYKYIGRMACHPFRVSKKRSQGQGHNYLVAEHRLVMEAEMNGVEFDQFIEDLRVGELHNYEFLDPTEFVVHHVDENPQNNHPSNLVIMTPKEHKTYHAEDSCWRNGQARIAGAVVIGISPYGEEDTYDLTMGPDDDPNFLANGVVVHNCGKTEFGLTMPGPLAIINLDEGLDGVIQEHQEKKEIYVAGHRSSLVEVKSMDGTSKAIAEVAMKEWVKVKAEYIESLSDGSIRSVFVDTGTELYELVRLAYFGKLTQVMPHQYGIVNKEMKTLIDLAYDSEKNVLFSHRLRREYVNDKATQNYELAGWKDMGFEAQIVIQQWKEPKEEYPDRYHLTLMDCRIRSGAHLEGEDLQGEMVNFPTLAGLIFGSASEEWE